MDNGVDPVASPNSGLALSGAPDSQLSSPKLSTASPPPAIPDHQMLRCIGRGSYGEVWLARSVLGEYRAVKVIHRRDFGDNRPFEREFEGIRRYEPISRSHESQVQILHVGLDPAGGYFYYVMELADGEEMKNAATADPTASSRQPSILNSEFSILNYRPKTLRSLITPDSQPSTLNSQPTASRLPLAQCLEIGLALTTALAHLHQQGLVHRDVKPSNIVFVKGRPKLADIGLVTDVGDAQSIVGTEGYLPPEGPGAPTADIYALGMVLYEISTGRDRRHFPDLPLDFGDRSSRREEAHASDSQLSTGNSQPANQSLLTSAATGLLELNEILLKACARDARQRYQSAEEMRDDLTLLQAGKSVRRKRTNQERLAAGKKAGLALLVLAVIVVGAVSLRRQLTPAEYAGEGPPSTNDLATALCEKAMRIIEADNYAALPEAYANFTNAIALDPNYARPYVGLFDLRTHLPVSDLPPATPAELRGIVRKLEELGPNLAATHQAQSWMSFFALDFPQAESRILEALKADPKIDPAWYGFMLTHWGRTEEARKQMEIALAIAPSLAINYRIMGHTYYVERNYTNAIAWYRQAVKLEPREVAGQLIGQALRAQGDFTNAIDSFEKAKILNGADESATKQSYDELRHSFEERGPRGYWEEQWKRTVTDPNGDLYGKAVIQIHLGNTNAAIDWLFKTYDARDRREERSQLISLLFDECWDGLHDNPRFKELLHKIGFTKVMRKRKK